MSTRKLKGSEDVLPDKIARLYAAYKQPFVITFTNGDSVFAFPDGLAQEDEGIGIFLRMTDERGTPLYKPGLVVMENEIEKFEPINTQ